MGEGERGRHDSHADDERPDEPQQPVGGSEWLLQQLSGGRLKSIFEAPRAEEEPPTAEPATAEPPTAEPASERPADPIVASVPEPEPVSEPASEPEPAPEPEPEPDVLPAPGVDPEPAELPQAPEQLIDADPSAAAELTQLEDDEVYQWPPVAAPDEPFVWEEIADPVGEDEDEDDEFWRAATVDPRPEPSAGAFVWNLTPTVDEPEGPVPDALDEPELAEPTDPDLEEPTEPDLAQPTDPDLAEFEPLWEPQSSGEEPWQPEDVHEAEILDDPDDSRDGEELPELVLEHSETATPDARWDEDADPDTVDESAADYAPLAYASTSARSHVNGAASTGGTVSPSGTPRMGGGSKRTVVIVAVSIGAVVVLGALLLLGMFLSGQSAPVADPAPSASASVAPEPTAALPTVGPLPAGTYAWNQLLGGECLQPMNDVWAEEFTVVDCSGDHAAQLVAVGQIADVLAFPGTDALAAQVAGLCQADGVVDLAAAATFGDVQVQGTFPVTNEQWIAGERTYYCFVNRAGGAALTGSLVPAA
ncbi:hypothetical protein HQQ81_00210 [Microbacteriaceae bacterium VKM Ac-2854]|nr:hypothetical protein [Microbacteriaceae bacterium VKM Ac-2854]